MQSAPTGDCPISDEREETESDAATDAEAAALAVAREDQQLEAALEQLPVERQRAIVQVVQSELSHSGPLPPPQQLREYDHVLPGLAERIVRLTEVEQEHRHSIVTTAVRRDARLKERGQALGMVALILMLAFCIYLAATGSPEVAGGVAGGLILGVVGIFVTGRRADSKALSEERNDDGE